MPENVENAIIRVLTNIPASDQNDLLTGLNDGVTAQTATGSKSTYLAFSTFDQSGLKITLPASGSVRTALLDIMQNGDAYGSGLTSGSKTEAVMDRFMEANGFQKLPSKYASNNGIDGLYIIDGGDLANTNVVTRGKIF